MRNSKYLFLLYFFSHLTTLSAQEVSGYRLHSHNDYLQSVPFWEAYANGMESIEADVIFMEEELYVAHEKESVIKNRTLASLYLEPIRKAFELDLGDTKQFQLLIDIKTEPYSTLEKLEEVLSFYEDILTGINGLPKVEIVISGNRPKPEEYDDYSDYILFDYQSVTETADLPLHKISLISLNFKKFSNWDGKGGINERELEGIKEAIGAAHSLKKPIRFWATPDTEAAWETLINLGVDFINTDHPYRARVYLNDSQ